MHTKLKKINSDMYGYHQRQHISEMRANSSRSKKKQQYRAPPYSLGKLFCSC